MKYIKSNKYSILSYVSKYGFFLVIILAFFLPVFFVGADTNISTKIENPLGSLDTIPAFIIKIIEIALVIGVPIVALAIIYTGFLFIQAQGNEKKITEAKDAFLYTVIGAVILLGAFVIANAIKGTVDDIRKGA